MRDDGIRSGRLSGADCHLPPLRLPPSCPLVSFFVRCDLVVSLRRLAMPSAHSNDAIRPLMFREGSDLRSGVRFAARKKTYPRDQVIVQLHIVAARNSAVCVGSMKNVMFALSVIALLASVEGLRLGGARV
jgi:hypothetical protein